MADTETAFVIHNDNVLQTLVPSLERLLPSSTPLLRRIQFDIAHPQDTAYYLASANLAPQSPGDDDNGPWIAAYVDLFAAQETQVWIYSSLEADVDNGHDDDNPHISTFSSVSPERQAVARRQIWDLLQYINRELMPAFEAYYHKTLAATTTTSTHKVIPPHKPPAMLLGTLHTGLIQLLSSNDSYTNATFRPGLKVHRYDVTPYVKYIFDPSIFQTAGDEEHTLPRGYRYGEQGLLPQHVELVRSRTHIPREPQTLLSMPSVVVYHDDSKEIEEENGPSPVAWGFMWLDGSLATLHVEPEHRGKGLAVLLSREIMRRGMDSGKYGTAGPLAYTHTDVALENTASRRVMEKVGGQGRWSITWTVVEVVH
jgi:GNAT superfamily N-acetyltransferase